MFKSYLYNTIIVAITSIFIDNNIVLRNYVDLIDLTGNTSNSSSDDDSLPVFSFSSKADSAR